MTYYCASCKRATDAYDLWPNGECTGCRPPCARCAPTCVCCYTATEDLMDTDAKMLTVSYRFPVPYV